MGNPLSVFDGYSMRYVIRLLLCVLSILLACGCACSKVYIDPSEVDGLGAVVEFPSGRIMPIKLKDVISGNKIKLTNNETVVYAGISIPDLYTIPESARKLNEKLLSASEIRLEFDIRKRDSKGNLMAYLFTSDGRLINAEIVRAGLAKVLIIPPNEKYKGRLLEAESEARKDNIGLWSEDFGNK